MKKSFFILLTVFFGVSTLSAQVRFQKVEQQREYLSKVAYCVVAKGTDAVMNIKCTYYSSIYADFTASIETLTGTFSDDRSILWVPGTLAKNCQAGANLIYPIVPQVGSGYFYINDTFYISSSCTLLMQENDALNPLKIVETFADNGEVTLRTADGKKGIIAKHVGDKVVFSISSNIPAEGETIPLELYYLNYDGASVELSPDKEKLIVSFATVPAKSIFYKFTSTENSITGIWSKGEKLTLDASNQVEVPIPETDNEQFWIVIQGDTTPGYNLFHYDVAQNLAAENTTVNLQVEQDMTVPAYYSITGQRIANPTTPGIYIKKTSTSTSKILIR